VRDGGEIWMLDSANFNSGTVDIAKSVSIIGLPGQVASIVTVNGSPAATISVPVQVGFRNVVIGNNAVHPGLYGISISGGATVWMEDSLFLNTAPYSLYVLGASTTVDVKNTSFRMSSGYAVWAESGPAVTVAKSHATAGFASVAAANNSTTSMTVSDTDIVLRAGSGWGVLAGSQNASGTALAHVVRCTIQSGSNGVHAESTAGGVAKLYVGSSSIARADTSFYSNGTGASIISMGNNDVDDSPTPVSAAVTAGTLR